jgi:hypothetical protein
VADARRRLYALLAEEPASPSSPPQEGSSEEQ